MTAQEKRIEENRDKRLDEIRIRRSRARVRNYIIFIIVSILVAGGTFVMCGGEEEEPILIGVSQATFNDWRIKGNREMTRQARFMRGTDVVFTNALGSDAEQIRQIDSLVSVGVKALIVSPGSSTKVTVAIQRAQRAGVPVVILQNPPTTGSYDCEILYDTYDIGRKAALYVASALGGKGRVLEVTGYTDNVFYSQIHKGFTETLAAFPDIELAASVAGQNKPQLAFVAALHILPKVGHVDFVFGHTEEMVAGVRRAFIEQGANSRYIGVGAIMGRGNGLECIANGQLDASITLPTHGYMVMQIADSLARGLRVQSHYTFPVDVVDRHSVGYVTQQESNILSREATIDHLMASLNGVWESARLNQATIASVIVIFLLLSVVLMMLIFYNRIYMNNNQLYTEQRDKLETQKEAIEAQSRQLALLYPPQGEEGDPDSFEARLRNAVKAHIADAGFDTDQLAEALQMTRTDLVRRMKHVVATSPQTLIRTARLARAEWYIETTDKNVAQIAYLTGFGTPAYFTRCYRDFFGTTPRQSRASLISPNVGTPTRLTSASSAPFSTADFPDGAAHSPLVSGGIDVSPDYDSHPDDPRRKRINPKAHDELSDELSDLDDFLR